MVVAFMQILDTGVTTSCCRTLRGRVGDLDNLVAITTWPPTRW
jgi:hypothetical protein